MNEQAGPPHAEDFGLSSTALETTPEAFFVRHRNATVVVTVGATLVASSFAVFDMGGSVAASAFFAPILVAASLILLLPVVFGCVCTAGVVETWWRVRFDPEFAACARFLIAREAFQWWPRDTVAGDSRHRAGGWLLRNRRELLAEVHAELDAVDVTVADRETSGFDLLVHSCRCIQVIRCEAGRSPVGAGVGRELQAALTDTGYTEAVLVAPAGPSPALQRYLDGRPIRVLDAQTLAGGRLGGRLG